MPDSLAPSPPAPLDVDVNAVLAAVHSTLKGLHVLEKTFTRRHAAAPDFYSEDLMPASICHYRVRELEDALTAFCESTLALQATERRVLHTLDRLRKQIRDPQPSA